MPKLPVLKATELVRALEKVVPVPAHPGQDLGRGLLRKVLRDAELTRDEFVALLK